MFDDLVMWNDRTSQVNILTCLCNETDCLRHMLPNINPINGLSSDVVVELSVLFPCSHKHKPDAAANMEKKTTHTGWVC